MIERDAAEWAARFRFADAPAAVRETVERIFLDAVASGAAGLSQQLVRDIEPVATSFAGDAAARTTFVAAYAITSATVCDVYRPGLCHVTPVTVPPLLALAEDGATDEFLAALTVGLELTPRLCQALNYPELRGRGWHAPGVAGPVGAAAAAARLLKLGPDGVVSAMAHAAAQAAGTFAALGTEAVKFNQARAATSALLATLMARAELVASPDWLTAADGGMTTAYTRDADPARLTVDLDDRWELMQISLRRWPAASSVQSLIDVCRSLDVTADDIDHIEIELAPAAFQVSGPRPWRTALEAQQSAAWVTASVLADGDWWLEHSGVRLGDPSIDALARRVQVTPNDALAVAAVRLRVTRRDGEQLERSRETAPGDPDAPLTHLDIEEKLRRAAPNADHLLVAIDSGSYTALAAALSNTPVAA